MRKLYRVKTFSLSDQACSILETYAQETGLSQTKILEMFLSRPDLVEQLLKDFVGEAVERLESLANTVTAQ